jgi:hypothetical protein
MRKVRPILAARALIGLICATSWGQGFSQQASESVTKGATQNNSSGQNAKPDGTTQPEQPTSLGDAARLACTKKGNPLKSSKTLDDDNFPRTHSNMKEKAVPALNSPGMFL